MADNIAGFLTVGSNERGEVVVNLGHDMTGHVVFSVGQARQFAETILRKAEEAEHEITLEPVAIAGGQGTKLVVEPERIAADCGGHMLQLADQAVDGFSTDDARRFWRRLWIHLARQMMARRETANEADRAAQATTNRRPLTTDP